MTLTPAQIEFDDQGRLTSTAYGDIYFQPGQAMQESEYVFLKQGGFYKALERGRDITVAELGFGTGLNFLLSAKAWQGQLKTLHYISFEKHPIRKNDLQKIHGCWPALSDISSALLDNYPFLDAGIHTIDFPAFNTTLTLVFGDVLDYLPDMQFRANIWYLDGFAPAKNPDMWTEKLWKPLARNTSDHGRITTFTAAGAVRRGLQTAGFDIEKVKGYGRKRDMVIGILQNRPNPKPFDARHFPIPHSAPVKTAAVIGAGIAGCSLAEALTRRGIHVILIDKGGEPATGASGNPRAAVYPKLGVQKSSADQIYRQAFDYTVRLYQHLTGSTFEPCGVFQIDRNDDIKTRHQKIAARRFDPNLVQYLDTDTVTGLNLKQGGLYFPHGGTVCPPDLCRALLDKTEKTGLLETRFSTCFEKSDDIQTDIIILADADHINALPDTGWIPLEIVRGQVSSWAGTNRSRALKTVICHKGYITPATSTHILGATFDKGATDTNEPLDTDHQRNLKQLFDELPFLKTDYNLDGLNGRRANRIATPDRLPLCGPIINYAKFHTNFAALKTDAKTTFNTPPVYHENLYVLGALGSHGFTTAPWLADILAAHISGAPTPATTPLYNALSPTRFAMRKTIKGS